MGFLEEGGSSEEGKNEGSRRGQGKELSKDGVSAGAGFSLIPQKLWTRNVSQSSSTSPLRPKSCPTWWTTAHRQQVSLRGGVSCEPLAANTPAGVGAALWCCKERLDGTSALPTPPSLGDFFGLYSKKWDH